MNASHRIAETVIDVATRLAEVIDLERPSSLQRCSDLREAFIQIVTGSGGSLLEMVRDTPEMQLHMEDGYQIVDYDRRPCLPDQIEEASNRLFETIQTAALDRDNPVTREKIIHYVALELAGLWYPRCDGLREVTGLTPTQFRPFSELPPKNRHHILIRDPEYRMYSALVENGKVRDELPEDLSGHGWMFAPV